MVTWQNAVTDKDGHLTKAFQKENMTRKTIAKRICQQKLESSLIKSLSEKMDILVLFGSGRRQLDHAVTVQFSGVARSRYRPISTCVKGGVTPCKH